MKRARKSPLRFYLFWIFSGFILLLLTLLYISPEKIEYVEQGNLNGNAFIHYDDLNNDGIKEKLYYYHYHSLKNPNVFLYGKNQQFKEIWTLKGESFKGNILFCLDINNDLEKECYTFTLKDNTLWMHLILASYQNSDLIHSYPVQLPKELADNPTIHFLDTTDMNQDKIKEILFTIHSGNSSKFIFQFDFTAKNIRQIETDYPIESIQKLSSPKHSTSYIALTKEKQNEYKILRLSNKLEIKDAFPLDSKTGKDISILVKNNTCILLDSNPKKNQMQLIVLTAKGDTIAQKKLAIMESVEYALLGADKERIWLLKNREPLALNYQLEPAKKHFLYNPSKIIKQGIKSNYHLIKTDLEEAPDIPFLPVSDEMIIAEKFRKNIKIQNISSSQKENIYFLQAGSKWNRIKVEQHLVFYGLIVILLIGTFIPLILLIVNRVGIIIKKWRVKKQWSIQNDLSGKKEQILSYKLKKHHFIELLEITDIPFKIGEKIPKGIMNDFPITEILHDICIYYSKDKLSIVPVIYPLKKWSPLETNEKILLLKVIKGILSQINKKKYNRKVYLHVIQYSSYIQILLEDIDMESNEYKQNFISDFESPDELFSSNFSIDISKNKGYLVKIRIPIKETSKPRENKIKIILAEDHDVSLFGLLSLLKREENIEVVGTAKNGKEVLALLKSKKADIVITDIAMPEMDGVELSAVLNDTYPEVKTIVFTMYMENWFIEKLMENNVKGFVSKSSRTTELIEAIKNASKNLNYYCPQFQSKINPDSIQSASPADYLPMHLSKMETDILRIYYSEQDPKVISDKLDISVDSVSTFLEILKHKLKADTPDQLIKYAYKVYDRPTKNLH